MAAIIKERTVANGEKQEVKEERMVANGEKQARQVAMPATGVEKKATENQSAKSLKNGRKTKMKIAKSEDFLRSNPSQ